MRKERFLEETQRMKMFENSGIDAMQGANLISVDIQPEYEKWVGFDIYEYTQYLNTNYEAMNSLTFLYNGSETLDMVTEYDYMYWLMDNGLAEDVVNGSTFYDKGYAFFRYCMDMHIEDEEIVTLIQFMIRNDINDSRDLDEEMWTSFMAYAGADESDVRDLLEPAEDMINIPDLMDFLKRYGGKLILTGGGINECLKEVEIALMALQKPYNVLTQFTY